MIRYFKDIPRPICQKTGYNHSIRHCVCYPAYGQIGYCQKCFTKIRDFTVTKDWYARKYHKKCYFELKDEGAWDCEFCGFKCNEFLEIYCDCEEEE